jgi:RNA polymerase sigma-70 factor (ECF subfamily)
VTGSRQNAEDVVQETFLKAYRQLDRFESRASFGTWVHRIAMNRSVDLLRARPRREHATDMGRPERDGRNRRCVHGVAGPDTGTADAA